MEIIIDKELEERLNKFIADVPEIADEVNKSALKKAIARVREVDLEGIQDRYSVQKKVVKLRTGVKKGEAVLRSQHKRNLMENFAVSMSKPGRSKSKLQTEIIKGSTKTWSTMFWAFYKQHAARLMKRQGAERYKISNVTGISNVAMGKKALEMDLLESEIEKIYNQELLEMMGKYGY